MGINSFVNRPSRPDTAAPRISRQEAPAGLDIPLVLVIIALGVFGLLMLFSASADFSLLVYGEPGYMFNKQLAWIVIGTLVAVALARIDYHLWQRLAIPMMAVSMLLLIGVLINNEVRLGAVRTFFGGSVQPSELAKLATIIYLSVWLYAKREHLHDAQLGLIPLAVILGAVGGLIYIQPDLSATITIFLLGGMLFFLAGGDLRQMVLFMIVALAAGWLVVQFSTTGRVRLVSYLAGLKDPLSSDYQVRRSLEAIIRGGWFGVGLGRASTKLTGLPVPPTDSIFAVVVEEMGLMGALMLICLYGLLLWRGLKIAARAPDMLGALLAGGATFWIVIDATINMSVMVGLLPFAGNALPFISAGGSSLISSLAAIGILLSVSRQAGQRPALASDERRKSSASVDLRRRDRRRGQSRSRRPAISDR
ncbi:MAG: cell division protein FtsW [Anaerolineales bacterium]|nr:cell division protein FtsW [Anaerolineales bacterium]